MGGRRRSVGRFITCTIGAAAAAAVLVALTACKQPRPLQESSAAKPDEVRADRAPATEGQGTSSDVAGDPARPSPETRGAPPPPPMRDRAPIQATGGVDPRDVVWVRVDEAVEPRAAAQMMWVVELQDERGRHACSATWVGASTLLTAAHCVDARVPLQLAGGERLATDDAARACAYGTCSTPFRDGDYDALLGDLATLDAGRATPPAGAMPRLARTRGGAVRGAYLLSGLHHQARAVCRVEVGGGMGQAPGTVDLGESGSAVLAFHRGEPVIIGVVSHRRDDGDGWYFALVPATLPWPSGGNAPRPLDVATDELEEIAACGH